MLCSQCKAQIPEDSVFCSNCGARLERGSRPAGLPLALWRQDRLHPRWPRRKPCGPGIWASLL